MPGTLTYAKELRRLVGRSVMVFQDGRSWSGILESKSVAGFEVRPPQSRSHVRFSSSDVSGIRYPTRMGEVPIIYL